MKGIILKHRAVILMGAASLAFTLGGFVWAAAVLGAQEGGAGPFIMHFNDISGITLTGSASMIGFAGILAAILVIVNFAVAFEFDRRDPVFGKLMAAAGLAASVLLFIACAAIINVNV